MKTQDPDRGWRGFTLIELLVVLAVAMILMAISAPSLWQAMHGAKMRGVARGVTTLIRQARMDAIKTGAQAVVRIELPSGDAGDPGKIVAFSDRDFNEKLSATDPVLGRVELPTGVGFGAPPDVWGKDSVDGFSPDPEGGSLPKIVVFQGDGSVEKAGAFRFGDDYGNFLELRIDPAATARLEVRKCRECTNAGDPTDWYVSGTGKEAWDFK